MSQKLRIKFSGRIRPEQNPAYWAALFPGQIPVVDGCEFTFDPDARDYDWLVVYEDLMYPSGSVRSTRSEPLDCHRDNTLLITQEPSAIKIYGPKFLSQYGHVLSAQPSEIINHNNHILQVSPIRWFYGRPLNQDDHNYVTLDELRAMPIPDKNTVISTVCSDKQMSKTLKARYDLTAFLNNKLGDKFDWFGRGIRPVNDKAEAMNNYLYHLAIENHIFPHYWTEKIADSFLAYCLPFYYGPSNISDYFDPKSYVPIDIFKPEEALEIIEKTLKDDLYKTRFPAIQAAREKVLYDYNLMTVAARIATSRHQEKKKQARAKILGRHAFRNAHPILAMHDLAHRAKFRGHNRL